MRAPNETDLITFQGWTLRVRPASSATPRLLLLLHGWTGDEDSMWVFVRNFPADYWMIAPRAPHVAEPAGYSWRPPPSTTRGWPGLEDFRPAAEALISLADAYAAQNQINALQFDVIGFSQGAALTNTLALLYPERIRRAGVLAGFIPAHAESVVEKRPLNGKPFFVAHGTLDEMVKVEYARQSIQMLERAGANVTSCEDEVGHKVSANCMRALEKFFTSPVAQ
ncbi:MAG: alpha/beta fold hydrolase [Chloroflexi bacterium]|nr:alpha/beta fold hydrolase [Chloroflexota bacterium]